jgi:hypothetical protein
MSDRKAKLSFQPGEQRSTGRKLSFGFRKQRSQSQILVSEVGIKGLKLID